MLAEVVEQLRFAENINWSSQKDFIRGELVRGEASVVNWFGKNTQHT